MSQDKPPIAIEIPADRWEKLPLLPDALAAALEGHFAEREVLYYEWAGVWYSVSRELLMAATPTPA